jgi:hypothetical protein
MEAELRAAERATMSRVRSELARLHAIHSAIETEHEEGYQLN